VIVRGREKMHSCEFRKALNVESLLFQLKLSKMSPASSTHGKATERSTQDQIRP